MAQFTTPFSLFMTTWQMNSKQLTSSGDIDTVVRVWTRESKHNYENNSNINEEFVCPSASKFVIEFDSRCHTERR